MAVVYSQDAVDARLGGIVTAIGATGSLILYDGSTEIAVIPLENPCGTVDAGILTLTAPITVIALATGTLTRGMIFNTDGTVGISGLTVGISEEGENITVSNGLNSLDVTEGQQVTMLGGEIESLDWGDEYLLLEGGAGYILLESGGFIIVGP